MRLIDAKKCPCYTCRTQCCENPMRCTFFGLWLQKQAYDVEAVVAELEKYMDDTRMWDEDDFYDGKAQAYEHAISIVRGKE